jgi:hypothetical protein
MPENLFFITKYRNVKRILFSVLASLFFLSIAAQVRPLKDKDKENKKEEIREERRKASIAARDSRLKHHLEIQTKKVQRRMKKNLRHTNKYYSRKLHQTFFQKIFHWNRKRKIKNKYEHNAAIHVQERQNEKRLNKQK